MSVETQPPREFGALREKIAERATALPRRLAQVAEFALANPDDLAFGTAATVAQQAGVQPSTLVRFSQAFGFSGFSDLQDVFRQRLRARVPSYAERLKQVLSHGADTRPSTLMLEGFMEAAERSVAELRAGLDADMLERAIDILTPANSLYLIGLRRSFPVAVYLAYAMGKLGIRNVLVDGVAGLAAEQIASARPDDAVLAISFTPYASETVALAESARARGVGLVSITDSVFSPIASIADAWLGISEADYEGFRSMAATMALASTLAVGVAGRRAG
jgi:DNA-binding MurR/RpiR family transcriptional regulator